MDDTELEETILLAYRKGQIPTHFTNSELKNDEGYYYIDPPMDVSPATWLDEEKVKDGEKVPEFERKLFNYEICSIRKRNGERKYLRELRLGSITDVIKYHDE